MVNVNLIDCTNQTCITGVSRQKPQGGGVFFYASLSKDKHESAKIPIYWQFFLFDAQCTNRSHPSVKVSHIDYEILQISKGRFLIGEWEREGHRTKIRHLKPVYLIFDPTKTSKPNSSFNKILSSTKYFKLTTRYSRLVEWRSYNYCENKFYLSANIKNTCMVWRG